MIQAIMTNLPIFIVLLPLFTAFFLPTIARKIRLVEALVFLAGLLLVVATVCLSFILIKRGGVPIIYELGGWSAPWGIELKIDNLSVFFLLVVALVSLPVSLFGQNNLHKDLGGTKNTARFYTLYLLLIGSLAAMAFTNDLFNIFVLVEVSTLSCCALVSSRNTPKAAKAAFSYLILASVGSALILGGIGFLYIITGHLNIGFAFMELANVWLDSPHVVWLAFAFFLVGFSLKIAFFPLHLWLPDAHSAAPTPASAILSGLAIKGYFICFIKILYNVFGSSLIKALSINRLLLLLGMVAIIAGSLLAIIQDELKRRLAYSTVAQVGYLFVGLGFLNTQGLTGTLLYLAGHAICKSILFLAAGAIISATGKEKVSELAGVGRKMPLTMAAFTLASLGLIGIPLLPGFIGKWHLISGSLTAGQYLPVVVIIIGSVLCAVYLLPLVRTAYFAPAANANEGWKDPPRPQQAALILLMAVALFFGMFPEFFLRFAERAAAQLLALI